MTRAGAEGLCDHTQCRYVRTAPLPEQAQHNHNTQTAMLEGLSSRRPTTSLARLAANIHPHSGQLRFWSGAVLASCDQTWYTRQSAKLARVGSLDELVDGILHLEDGVSVCAWKTRANTRVGKFPTPNMCREGCSQRRRLSRQSRWPPRRHRPTFPAPCLSSSGHDPAATVVCQRKDGRHSLAHQLGGNLCLAFTVVAQLLRGFHQYNLGMYTPRVTWTARSVPVASIACSVMLTESTNLGSECEAMRKPQLKFQSSVMATDTM